MTEVNLKHNDHEVNKEVFEQANVNFSKEEEELIKVLAVAKTKLRRIQKVLIQRVIKEQLLRNLKI